jgi:methyl-accepting chemotaxis protein
VRDDGYETSWWEWVKSEVRYISIRRRFLINHRSQLAAAFMVTGVVLVLVVLLNLTFTALRNMETRFIVAEAPEIAQVLAGNDRTELILTLVGSLVVVLGTFFMTIFETHRTAGAAFNVARNLEKVAGGDYQVRLRLRRTDNLREIMRPFNQLTQALRDRAASQADELERLAATLEDSGSVENAVAQLRDVAKRTRGESDPES